MFVSTRLWGTNDLGLLKSNLGALEYLKLSCGPYKHLSSSGSHFLVESIFSEFQTFQVPNSWWALDRISAPLSLWSCPKCHSASQPPLVELTNAPMSLSSSKNGLTSSGPLSSFGSWLLILHNFVSSPVSLSRFFCLFVKLKNHQF